LLLEMSRLSAASLVLAQGWVLLYDDV
jgi:hypothetical protein